jgi:hypothetical protein
VDLVGGDGDNEYHIYIRPVEETAVYAAANELHRTYHRWRWSRQPCTKCVLAAVTLKDILSEPTL